MNSHDTSNQAEPEQTSAVEPKEASGSTATPEPKDDETLADARLSAIEARVLGALMEKQLSTPDSYPLTVNSLVSACNQKSNREPISTYEQGEVVRTLRILEQKRYVRYEMGSRSERYDQRLTNELNLSKKQQALICMLMLRGPQTSGELQTRTQRLFDFADREDMQLSLDRMTQGTEPTAILIPRQPGQRDDRYGHLLCGIPTLSENSANKTRGAATTHTPDELNELKEEVRDLRQQLNALYKLTGHPIGD